MDIESKIDELTVLVKEGFKQVDKRFEQVDTRLNQVESDISSLKNDVNIISLTIENEISPNIKAVAEGHLDLSRNLHEAIKTNNLVEMLSVKVNMLETRVRELERRVS